MITLLYKVRTARKKHRCIWCPCPILPGEKYVDERAVFDGDFQALKFHPECKGACSKVARMDGGDFDIDAHQFRRGSTQMRGSA